ncbi:MAG: TetR/AcrR family transcriptional regulator C-terminal domain-containing protein [Propionibacteriaceae bacterium]|nr:TetR/AcrR family transcriptional regulator C-terminal domain-containing protein [Propionibacteriaceae bacterium]
MLNSVRIVAAGCRILDDWGLADLSMRRVADELGVQAGALYYHVPNKQSLLAGIADVILGAVPTPAAEEPGQWLRAWSAGLRQVLLSHRDGAELVSSTTALGLGQMDPTAEGSRMLQAAGLPQPEATMAAFLHFVLGHVMAEQTRSQLVALGVLDEFDAEQAEADFSHGVDLLVRGLRPEPR